MGISPQKGPILKPKIKTQLTLFSPKPYNNFYTTKKGETPLRTGAQIKHPFSGENP